MRSRFVYKTWDATHFQVAFYSGPYGHNHQLANVLAVACYASAFLAYAAALTRLPLSVVNPIVTSGTTVMVAIIGFTLFREPMRATTCIGIATVIFGVLLITRN